MLTLTTFNNKKGVVNAEININSYSIVIVILSACQLMHLLMLYTNTI